jgi:hypothetical protein
MNTSTRSRSRLSEVRCPACGALLGTREAGGLSIKRSDAQATITGGDFQVSLVCWRRGCKKLTVLRFPARPALATA